MKKSLFSVLAAAMLSLSASAQGLGTLGIFNHVGLDLSVSTTGIGLEVSTPITPWVQLRAGASMLPNINISADFDGYADISLPTGETSTRHFDVDLDAKLGRVQGDVIFNIYPFGKRNNFFVAAGAYFGGQKVMKIQGHSPEMAEILQQYPNSPGYIEVGDYKIDFDKQGNIMGGIKVNNFRPYLGLGVGRPCPNKRLGFMVELGVQFMGKLKVYQGEDMEIIDIDNMLDNDDDWQKWIDKLTVYPVIKFTLSGRIF